VVPFGFASLNAWMLGRADAALEREAWMMAAVEANGNNPQDMAWAGYLAASLRSSLKDWDQAESFAARALEVCEQNQFPNIAAYCRCTVGIARAVLGRAGEGVELIRAGLAGFQEVGTRIPTYVTILGWAQLIAGDIDGALASAEQALQAESDETTKRPTTRSGALTLRGQLRLIQGNIELAEADFREAVSLTRAIGAKGLELGAAVNLARLLSNQGRRDEARSMLAEIYGWFTEGFDTADLKDAKALLDELA